MTTQQTLPIPATNETEQCICEKLIYCLRMTKEAWEGKEMDRIRFHQKRADIFEEILTDIEGDRELIDGCYNLVFPDGLRVPTIS